VHPEVEEQKQKLKEILYDCAVEIRATKAALYLADGAGRFELVTEYGFRATAREALDMSDPIVDRAGRGRNTFFINGMTTEPRFAERLYESASDRLMVVPIYSRGQLVGLIDMRDKQAKAPFETTDMPKGQGIAERIADLFGNRNVFGQRFISLSETNEAQQQDAAARAVVPAAPEVQPFGVPAPSAPPPPVNAAPVAAPPLMAPPLMAPVPFMEPPPPRPEPVVTQSTDAMQAVRDARQLVQQRVNVPVAAETLSEEDFAAARDALKLALLVPGVVLASFSAYGHLGGVQEAVAKAPVSDATMKAFEAKLTAWMKRRGESAPPLRGGVETPFGVQGPPVTPDQLVKVLTAPIVVGSISGLALTVAFDRAPDRAAHDMLAAFHAQLQFAIEQSVSRGSVVTLRRRAAVKLLEPDFTRFPELRNHSDEVVSRADGFAKVLGLGAAEIENVRLTALLHDVGMRLLDYDRLYRAYEVSEDDLALLREHPAVGAALVEPVFGRELARAVLSHHERIDGTGYPHRLRGDDIPILSRIVQICDAYQAMVSTDSYQHPQASEAALSTLMLGAGTQFDRDLAQRFFDWMRAR
jgi:hypothetical protein